jgi:4-hydroxy-3-polyprenylbenzoate decarboxylase
MAAQELALVVSGASGTALAARFAEMVLGSGAVTTLHLVLTDPGRTVAGHELGPEWSSAKGFAAQLELADDERARIRSWADADLMAPISSGSVPLVGSVVLPCSAAMVGAIASGASRGLGQRVADVALKQGWPLLLGVRETPMSVILLANLHTLAQAGAKIVPPLPAFYLKPDPATAYATFVDHYCLRLLDLLGIELPGEGLRWTR